MDTLASTKRKLDKKKEAVQIFKEICIDTSNAYGENHPKTLEAQLQTAIMLSQDGNHEEAKEYLEKLVSLQLETFEKEDGLTLLTKDILASTYVHLGSVELQHSELTNLLQATEKLVGPEHASVLITKLKICNCDYKLENYKKAKKELKELIPTQKRVLRKRHNLTLCSMSTLALALTRLNLPSDGLKLLIKVVKIRDAADATDVLSLLNAIHNVAWCYAEQGKDFIARDIFQQLLPLELAAAGTRNPLTLTTMSMLASSLMELEEFDSAMEFYEKVAKENELIRGLSHPDTLKAKHSVAFCLLRQKRYNEAMEEFAPLLKLKIEVHGNNHPSTLTTKAMLGTTLHRLGETDNGLKMLREVLDVFKSSTRETTSTVIRIRFAIALCLLHDKMYEKAKEELEVINQFREEELGPRHRLTVDTKHFLGVALHKSGESAKGLSILHTVLLDRQMVRGVSHPKTLLTLSEIRNIQAALQSSCSAV